MNNNNGKQHRRVPASRIVSILKKIPIFGGLFDNEYEVLIGVCNVVQFSAGDVLFSEGDPGKEMFILLSGSAEVRTEKAGTLCNLQSGELVGEIAVVSKVPRSATVEVTKDASFMCLSQHDIELLVGKAPRTSYVIVRNIAQTLAERLSKTNQRIENRIDKSEIANSQP